MPDSRDVERAESEKADLIRAADGFYNACIYLFPKLIVREATAAFISDVCLHTGTSVLLYIFRIGFHLFNDSESVPANG